MGKWTGPVTGREASTSSSKQVEEAEDGKEGRLLTNQLKTEA